MESGPPRRRSNCDSSPITRRVIRVRPLRREHLGEAARPRRGRTRVAAAAQVQVALEHAGVVGLGVAEHLGGELTLVAVAQQRRRRRVELVHRRRDPRHVGRARRTARRRCRGRPRRRRSPPRRGSSACPGARTVAAGPAAWAAGARTAATTAARQARRTIGGREPCRAAEVAVAARSAPYTPSTRMGNVVELEGSGRPRRRRRRRPRPRSCWAVAGFTGGVYEIGALRALDLLAVNRTVNDFDVYVGTSAGALVAALTANGVTPEQMMRVVNDQVPQPFPTYRWTCCCAPNYREFVSKGVKLPFHLLGVLRELGRSLPSLSTVDLAIALADAAAVRPLHRARGSRSTSTRCSRTRTAPTTSASSASSCTWPRPTWTPASGSCSAREGWDDVPISAAVRASTALPMVYQPHRAQGPRAGRRRDRLHHQPRHRGRGRREADRRRQPARPVRERLHEGDPDAVRHPHAPRLGHGLPEDRLPDVQAARLPAPARDGARAGRSATRASTSC